MIWRKLNQEIKIRVIESGEKKLKVNKNKNNMVGIFEKPVNITNTYELSFVYKR